MAAKNSRQISKPLAVPETMYQRKAMKITAAGALSLPVPERLQPVDEIWDSIAEFPEEIPLADATRDLLQKRLEEHRAKTTSASPWSEVKRRILRK